MHGAAAVLPQLALPALRQARTITNLLQESNASQYLFLSRSGVLGVLKRHSTMATAATDSHPTQQQSNTSVQQAPEMLPMAQQQQFASQLFQQQLQPQQWTAQQQHFMKLAIEQAKQALKQREVPIGCVIVRDDQVIGSGYNMTNHTRNATRHAELEAIDLILANHEGDVNRVGFDRCQLYVTIEPCIMCAGALSLIGLGQVYYGAANDKFGGCGSIMTVHQTGCGCCSGSEGDAPHGKPFQSFGGLYAEEAITLLQQFYVCGNPQAPKPKRAVVEVPPWQLGADPLAVTKQQQQEGKQSQAQQQMQQQLQPGEQQQQHKPDSQLQSPPQQQGEERMEAFG